MSFFHIRRQDTSDDIPFAPMSKIGVFVEDKLSKPVFKRF